MLTYVLKQQNSDWPCSWETNVHREDEHQRRDVQISLEGSFLKDRERRVCVCVCSCFISMVFGSLRISNIFFLLVFVFYSWTCLTETL